MSSFWSKILTHLHLTYEENVHQKLFGEEICVALLVNLQSKDTRHNQKRLRQLWAIQLDHMHKKYEINRTKIKGGCQSGRKVVTHNSKSDLPLGYKGVSVTYKLNFLFTFVFDLQPRNFCRIWCFHQNNMSARGKSLLEL